MIKFDTPIGSRVVYSNMYLKDSTGDPVNMIGTVMSINIYDKDKPEEFYPRILWDFRIEEHNAEVRSHNDLIRGLQERGQNLDHAFETEINVGTAPSHYTNPIHPENLDLEPMTKEGQRQRVIFVKELEFDRLTNERDSLNEKIQSLGNELLDLKYKTKPKSLS
jgi:hypothetical protein